MARRTLSNEEFQHNYRDPAIYRRPRPEDVETKLVTLSYQEARDRLMESLLRRGKLRE